MLVFKALFGVNVEGHCALTKRQKAYWCLCKKTSTNCLVRCKVFVRVGVYMHACAQLLTRESTPKLVHKSIAVCVNHYILRIDRRTYEQ